MLLSGNVLWVVVVRVEAARRRIPRALIKHTGFVKTVVALESFQRRYGLFVVFPCDGDILKIVVNNGKRGKYELNERYCVAPFSDLRGVGGRWEGIYRLALRHGVDAFLISFENFIPSGFVDLARRGKPVLRLKSSHRLARGGAVNAVGVYKR